MSNDTLELPVGSNGATNAYEYLAHAGSAYLRCNEAFTPTGVLIGCYCKLPVGHDGPCAGVWVSAFGSSDTDQPTLSAAQGEQKCA